MNFSSETLRIIEQASANDEWYRVISGVPVGEYQEKTTAFFQKLAYDPEIDCKVHADAIYFGNKSDIDWLSSIVNPRLKYLKNLLQVDLPQIIIIIGDEKMMLEDYILDAQITSPVPLAMSNYAQTVFINKTAIEQMGRDDPAINRAIEHEPSHCIFHLAIQAKGILISDLVQHETIIEALVGPLDKNKWKDLLTQDISIDFGPLERGEWGFYQWLEEMNIRNNIHTTYFENPIVAKFYEWASKQGDEMYWFKKALDIKNE